MKKLRDEGFRIVLIIGMVICAGLSTAAAAQEMDKTKLYQQIIGTYEFEYQGNYLVLDFWVDEGKLLGGPERDDFAEIIPVNLAEMKFEATNDDGEYYEIEFKKDEEGVVISCVLITSGIELEGPKIK